MRLSIPHHRYSAENKSPLMKAIAYQHRKKRLEHLYTSASQVCWPAQGIPQTPTLRCRLEAVCATFLSQLLQRFMWTSVVISCRNLKHNSLQVSVVVLQCSFTATTRSLSSTNCIDVSVDLAYHADRGPRLDLFRIRLPCLRL